MSAGAAFGLELDCSTRLPLLDGAARMSTGRTLRIEHPRATLQELCWPTDTTLISDERLPDGSVNFRIESHAERGYLLSGPEYGAFLLTPDGTALSWTMGAVSATSAQRFLIAQVLPFAAVLQGLEVLHASAVAIENGAVAILGASGSGKTTLALALCSLGASFLADDVLALQDRDDGLYAFPGTPIAGLSRETPILDLPDGEVVAQTERENLLSIQTAGAAKPLRAVLALERSSGGPQSPAFERISDAGTLLSATFNLVLLSPARLQQLLEVCAQASRLPAYRLRVGATVSARELARVVVAHLSDAA